MKAEFLIENVEKFLPLLTKVLPTHSQIPVLSNLLIEANEEGIFIYSTNLEIGVKIKIPGKVTENGSLTVPGKQFIEALSSFPKDKVEIESVGEMLKVASRDNSVSFQTISATEFPTIYEEKGEKIHEFTEEELKSVFASLIFAASQDEGRPELTGILVNPRENETHFVATDGFRLSLKKVKNKKIGASDQLIIPAKLISELLSAKSGNVAMYVRDAAKQVIFEVDDIILVGRLIAGQFPNYERVIPASSKTTIKLDVQEFIQKLRLAGIFARDSANIIKTSIKSGKFTMEAKSSGVGEGEVSLLGAQDGIDNEIAFNMKFLNDLLKSISSKEVIMNISSPVEPAMFKLEEDPDFVHIIMPVRVQD